MKVIKPSRSVKIEWNKNEGSYTVTETAFRETRINVCVEIEEQECAMDSSWIDVETGLLHTVYFPVK